jgi:hypothetical protein
MRHLAGARSIAAFGVPEGWRAAIPVFIDSGEDALLGLEGSWVSCHQLTRLLAMLATCPNPLTRIE